MSNDPSAPTRGEEATDEERIAGIVGRLNAATPGPWATQPNPHGGLTLLRGQRDLALRDRHIQSHLQIVPASDAALIANAPSDIAWLVERLQEARRDTTRIDWIAEQTYDELEAALLANETNDLREAIDAARGLSQGESSE